MSMSTEGLNQAVGLLARIVGGISTAVELNQTERLPALRAHAETIEAMIAEGRDPTVADFDKLSVAISDNIDVVMQRAQDARDLKG